ncbi:MAG: ATP-grasp domain-containing protein [Planctomycetes bacterium]|nr:ATP-grasp domain-containing protein [Planctomycetota bacterium]
MLLAIADDFARGEKTETVVTWDERLGLFPLSNIDARVVSSPAEEQALFRQLVQWADATLVIAPELDAALTERRRQVDALGGRYLGPDLDAIRLCSDKLATCQWLEQNNFPTVPTHALSMEGPPPPPEAFPVVLKRRDGAGSQGMQLVSNETEWTLALQDASQTGPLDRLVWQPFISGRSVSCLVLIAMDRSQLEVFPPADQRLTEDRRFSYQGGRLPAELFDATRGVIIQTARRVCEDLSGLRGFVGFDWIVPESEPAHPLIVDVNPRLTTSYIGYRALARENLARRLLADSSQWETIRWGDSIVAFRPDGTVAVTRPPQREEQ